MTLSLELVLLIFLVFLPLIPAALPASLPLASSPVLPPSSLPPARPGRGGNRRPKTSTLVSSLLPSLLASRQGEPDRREEHPRARAKTPIRPSPAMSSGCVRVTLSGLPESAWEGEDGDAEGWVRECLKEAEANRTQGEPTRRS